MSSDRGNSERLSSGHRLDENAIARTTGTQHQMIRSLQQLHCHVVSRDVWRAFGKDEPLDVFCHLSKWGRPALRLMDRPPNASVAIPNSCSV